jgi:hypothetical protein
MSELREQSLYWDFIMRHYFPLNSTGHCYSPGRL